MRKHGTLALDIDGTITDDNGVLPTEVAGFLNSCYSRGWSVIFITGREFTYAMQPLSQLNIPYYLAVQNGADLLAMPERKHLQSFYMDISLTEVLEPFFQKMPENFLVYAGYEKGDFCYYRPARFSPVMLEYLKVLQTRSPLPWQEVVEFSGDLQKKVPLIKAIGQAKDFIVLEDELLKHDTYPVIIQDPSSVHYDYLLVTDKKASKDQAVNYFLKQYQLPRPLIVAGDDFNDEKVLEMADISIVMDGAPLSLTLKADILAPPSHQQGIIWGLEQAFLRCAR